MFPLNRSRPKRPDAPLAKGLRNLIVLLAVISVLFGGSVAILTLQLKGQVLRLTAIEDIEEAHQTLYTRILDTEFLKPQDDAASVSDHIPDLQAALQAYAVLDQDNPLPQDAMTQITELTALIDEVTHHAKRTTQYLEEVTSGIAFFREKARNRTRTADAERGAASRIALAIEDEQRQINQTLLDLSNSIFSATRILNEVEGVARYNLSPAGRSTPLDQVTLSQTELPVPCRGLSTGTSPRNCTLSPDRVNAALSALTGGDLENTQARISAAMRALSAYIRSGEAQFQALSDGLNSTLELGASARRSMEVHAVTLDNLAELAAALGTADQLLERVAGGQDEDWATLNTNLLAAMQQIRSNASATASAATVGRITENRIDVVHAEMRAAWLKAYTHLVDTALFQDRLAQAVQRLNVTLKALSQIQREVAQGTAELISTVTLAAMLFVGALASALVWAAQNSVVRPLGKATQTILELSRGARIAPVRLGRRAIGMGVLEDALETLRLANLEREKLTKETLDQRAQIESNLNALAEKTRELTHLARHDPLTGLANRRYADELLASLDQPFRREPQDFTLLHVDLDRFKAINDTLGHEAGDVVLRHVAEVLERLITESDRAFRIGGDEFLVLITQTNPEKSYAQLAAEIIEHLNEPITYKGHACRIGASIGIAHGHDSGFNGREALVNADIALYEAKNSGRNQFVEFSQSLQEKTVSRKTLSDRLEQAIDNAEFVPYYQPQFYADSLELRGVETLCRWHHPEMGILPPSFFMEQAEASMLLGRIDQLLLEKAAADMERLRSEGHRIPKISFNVTADRLLHSGFAQSLIDHIGPDMQIGIELLESMSLDSLSEAVRWAIDDLKNAGIGIEIDDFGSCRASIAGLIAVGPDAMKIDGSIVGPITESPQHLQLMRAIIEIGRTLGIDVIAERVETMEHVRILQQNGCAVLQGFALAKPMDAAGLQQFLASDGPILLRSA